MIEGTSNPESAAPTTNSKTGLDKYLSIALIFSGIINQELGLANNNLFIVGEPLVEL